MGPPRVWVKDNLYPGLAMSRSLGDFYGEKVGVTSEPEIFSYKIESDDLFMIVASDGVWEYLSNSIAAEYVLQSFKANDRKGAASYLVDKAYEQWAKRDRSIDDVTAIVVFFR